MSEHDSASSHIKTYLAVGTALLVGTALTVFAARMRLGGMIIGIIVALIIASVKGGLVAGYFMHLLHERKPIYWILALTGVFIVVMVGLLLWTYGDQQGVHHGLFNVPARQPVVHHEAAPVEAEHVP